LTETAEHGFASLPMRRGCPFLPPAQYARLSAENPVSRVALPNGDTAWAISSYRLARELVVHPDVSADRSHPNYPTMLPKQPVSKAQAKGLLSWMDPPEHTTHRRMVVSEFTVKRIAAMAPHIRQVTEECLDQLLAAPPPVDLVQGLSLAVPSRVICELLGVPYGDRDLFAERTNVILNHHSTVEQRMTAWGELRAYLDGLVSGKETDPGEDLLSRLVERYRDAGMLDHEVLIGLAMGLLVGGHETTANMISLGTVFFLSHPEHLADFTAHPENAAGAVEELLRYFSIADHSVSRVTTADIEIGGVRIPKGEGVITLNAAANHDEAVFPDPAEFDPRRDFRRHMAFGYGVHQCIGQSLARLELEIVFTTLFSRVPGLRLAVPVEELAFKDDAAFYGLYEVPVTW
jgi:cytochrome P450